MTPWTSVDYRPHVPASGLGIGMVGCGGIARVAAAAYRSAGYKVAAVCDIDGNSAERMRDEFFPGARALTDHRQLLEMDSIDVVDIATHTTVRPPLVRDALLAGKHVQSQKPFVADLDLGRELCDLADSQGVRLSVNQNGRWSPHFAYLLAAVRSGILGDIVSADFDVHWNHDAAVAGSRFADMDDLVLLDFGIHWFDVLGAMFGRLPASVYAQTTVTQSQIIPAPTIASTILDYESAQATLLFRASATVAEQGRYRVAGTLATIRSSGPALGGPSLIVSTREGDTPIELDGAWMPDALAGTMGELLTAIEEDREPSTSARRVLDGLRTCFAAIESARTGTPTNLTKRAG